MRPVPQNSESLHRVWVDVPEENEKREGPVEAPRSYTPLVETLRLYAGWLLVWYFIVYALGAIQLTRHLPVRSLVVESLFSSSLIADCSCGFFLFLLCSSLHRRMGGGILLAMCLFLAGVVFLLLFAFNT